MMTWEKELSELREEIDSIDSQLAALFEKRMAAAGKIAEIKRVQSLAVQDSGREEQVVKNASELVPEDIREETAILMRTIIGLSRDYQRRLLGQCDNGDKGS